MEIMETLTNVEITTFINPHLFWIISSNEERKKLLTDLTKQMQAYVNNVNKNSNIFEVGEIVTAQIENRLYRAVIEDVVCSGNVHRPFYLLWLIDYGTMRESEIIYKLPTALRKTSPLSLQASLNKVVYIEQVLEIDSVGQLIKTNKHTINPSPTCLQECMKLLSGGHDFKFELEKKEEGIAFGDILYKDEDNNEKSLRNCLLQAGVVNMNETLFKGIADFINTYRENHLLAISKICNKKPYPLEGAANKAVNTSCTSIVSKILEEFQYSDLLSFEDEVAEPFWSFNKSKNDTNTSLDNTLSDNESVKIKSKKSQLMEKLWQHKNSLKNHPNETANSSVQDNDTSDSTEENNKDTKSIDAKTSVGSTSKIKKLIEQMKQHKIEKSKSLMANEAAQQKRKIIFSPAGSERSLIGNPKKKSCSKLNQNSDIYKKKKYEKIPKNHESVEGYMEETIPSAKYTSDDSSSVENSFPKEKLTKKHNNAEKVSSPEHNNVEKDSSTEQDSENQKEETSNTNCTSVQTLKIKPHCSCKQCNVWTKEENVFIEDLGSHPKVAKINGTKAQLLFKENENVEPEVDICSIDYCFMKKFEKQAQQKLLVHSEIITNPINQISKAAFHKDIHINLHRLEYREAKRIQSYAWPAILRNQHVFMINGPQTGKTMAYMPVMLTFILEKHDRYGSLMKIAGGPVVIILCESTHKCEEIYDLAKVILRNIKANVSLVTYPVTHINTSHTDMLITTPNILVELLKNKHINFKRLCHLIIEDGDTILTRHKATLNAIFELAQSMLKNRVFTKGLQLIVCAEHWNSQIKHLLKNIQQIPMVCIGNYLEAALYGQVEFSMKFVTSPCKQQELNNLLKDTHKVSRSIIVCKENEIAEIQEILTLKGIDNTPLHHMSQEDILHLEDVWTQAKGGTYSVLICCDFILQTVLSVTCATTLIHYSLPKSWTKFVKRFGCLLENCKSPLDSREHRLLSKSVVLCDESCKDQMYKFFNYINTTDLKKQLPEKLREFSKNLHCTEEEQKVEKQVALCGKLKLYGRCNKNQCGKRHAINAAVDISNYLPKSGKVKFKIVNVVDVTIYLIQLLQHIDDNNTIHEFDDVHDVTEDLTATLRLGRKKINHPVAGHRYAFYNFDEQEGNYYRCEVIDVENDCVQIKLLDNGSRISTMTSRLYRLPKEFDCDVKPRAIIDAYLANLIPPYQDENFSAKSFFNLKTILESHNYKNVIFTGEIHLQLDQTLWLADVYEEVLLSDKIIPGFQLYREILINKLAEKNLNQLNEIYKLCIDAGITLPTYQKKSLSVPVKKQEIKKQWAYLDVEQVNEVTFAAAFSPDEVYVRLNKFSDLLYTLQKDIQQSVKKPNYPKLQEVTVGEVYLAKDPDGLEYCRVLVLKKESDKALCFYVDFADEAVIPIEDLKYIQNCFITKLPFQCIKCRFYGIQPFGSVWGEDVTNALYTYAHEPGTDIFRTLFVKVCTKDNSDCITPVKYSVLVKDGFGEKNVLINQLLIECGMVIADSNESISDFEIPVAPVEAPEIDEELEEAAYICRKTDELDRYLQENGNNSINGQSNTNQVEENLDELELFCYGDIGEFIKQLVTGPEPVKKTNELPAITAAPNVDYCTPDVYWSQTETVVKLSIRLTDVQDYKLTLTKRRMFNFRTVRNEKTYCLKLMFYDHVESMQHTCLGPEIRVTINKSKSIDWPRLILSKQKTRNIHYDVTKIPLDNEEEKRFLQLPKELDDDSEDLNENDPMYTVYSDLDSDLDLDLEQDTD